MKTTLNAKIENPKGVKQRNYKQGQRQNTHNLKITTSTEQTHIHRHTRIRKKRESQEKMYL